MELKDFLNVLKKNWILITTISVLGIIIAVVVTKFIPTQYSASIDVYVSRRAISESENYYTYDGYYSTQSSVQYTSTVSGLFQSLQTIHSAYIKVSENENYVYEDNDSEFLSEDIDFLKKVSKRITVEDIAPQVINVSFKDRNSENANIWVKNLGEVVTNKVAELNKDSDGNFRIEVSSEPLIDKIEPNLIINVISSLMFGILIGILWAFGKEYLSENGNRS